MGESTLREGVAQDSDNPRSTVEQLDDRRRHVREFLQRTDEMLTRQRAGLVQRWLVGNINLIVVGFDVDNPKLGIVLEYASECSKRDSLTRPSMWDHGKEHGWGDYDQAFVLPRYVEIVECEQKGILPSVPRLQFFDDDLVGSGKPLDRLRPACLPIKN
jgi:hypothetical protein